MSTTVPTQFRELPLPQRMRLAAEVIEELEERHFKEGRPGSFYLEDPSRDLREWADTLEREDAQKDEKARAVKQLASDLYNLTDDDGPTLASCYEYANTLINKGWTKESE